MKPNSNRVCENYSVIRILFGNVNIYRKEMYEYNEKCKNSLQ